MRKMTKQDFFKSFKNQSHVEQLKSIEKKLESRYNETDNATEITIYGVIGSWWEDSISASDIDNILNNATGDIVIHLNSPGGDALDGVAIYNRLINHKEKHKAKITVRVDGYACSAASLFPLAADEAIMGLGSLFMIHEAGSFVWGTKTEMRKEADVLEELEEGYIDIYMTKANVSREDIRGMVDAETWFSAQKAVDIGFATSAASSDNKDTEIANLRTQIATMQNEINQLKKKEPAPAPEATASRFFF